MNQSNINLKDVYSESNGYPLSILCSK